MLRRIILISLSVIIITVSGFSQKSKSKQTFTLGTTEFLLNGSTFQIISGELHPSRIIADYWRHRILMAKAMGCDTISVSIMWNYHELEEGVFDFETGNRNLAQFFNIVQEEDLWLIVRQDHM